jgi:hypothetical protein
MGGLLAYSAAQGIAGIWRPHCAWSRKIGQQPIGISFGHIRFAKPWEMTATCAIPT